MVNIIEGYMTEQDIQEIENNVLNNSHFPWFWEGRTTSDSYPAMMHVMVGRYDEPPLTEFKINSPYFHLFERIFLDFCHKNNIQVNQILRAAVNLTWYSEDKYGDPHVDHPHEHGHKVCMMYLHDLSWGPTFIFNETGMGWAIDKENDQMKNYQGEFTIAKEVPFERGKIVIFPGEHCHAAGFVKKPNERRVAAVITFK